MDTPDRSMRHILARLAAFRRRLRASRLVTNERGATMLEFGFVAAPFVALLLATVETALASFTQQAVETSTEAAARLIMTGQVQSAGLTQQQFHDKTCKTLPAYLSCANLMVEVKTASSFGTVDLSPPQLTYDKNGNVTNTFAYDIGGGGAIVIVRLMYLWPVSPGPLGFSLASAGNGKYLVVGTNVAKSEPFT